ncbi:hypothetical protein [Streptomyces mirabilis]|uniref:hypothetical protein n=1 Tax=Streptomyces mirabilis TaxID=68239 RepID=UPI0033189E82
MQTGRAGDGGDRAGAGFDGAAGAGTAPRPDHRADPAPLRGRAPAGGEGLDDQHHRPRLKLDRKTVRRFRDTDLDELLASARERRPNGVLEPYKAYLNARFTETQGQVSGTRLVLEIHERGYRGSRQVVRKHLAALRAGTAEPVRADIPSPRKITSWIMRPRETLTESQDERLLEVLLTCPDITRACDLARAFADLVRHRRGDLPFWLATLAKTSKGVRLSPLSWGVPGSKCRHQRVRPQPQLRIGGPHHADR